MKIRELRVKHFGKFQNARICLRDGINLVAGENESGKSTLHTFIRGMFFGLRRMRGRASRTDTYSRYEPWEDPALYSGELVFESGGKRFRISRNFSRNQASERLICETDGELLSVADGDLNMLLGGISENIFENTVSVGQLKSVTGDGLAQELKNYMANCQGGLDGALDLAAAEEYLKKKRSGLGAAKREKQERQKAEKQALLSKLSYVRRECENLEENLRTAEENLKRQTQQGKDAPERPGEKSRGGMAAAGAAAAVLLLACVCALCMLQGFHPLLLAGLALSALLLLGIVRHSLRRRIQPGRPKEDPAGEQISRLQWNIEFLSRDLREKKTAAENAETEYREYCLACEEQDPLETDIAGVDLALETLKELSSGMEQKAGAGLRQRMSELLSALTEGRYTSVSVDGDLNLGLYSGNTYVPLYQASRGTLEQVYLALRLAAAELLCPEEELPLLLDEVFAMYDDRRLGRALKILADQGRQVLLFTCQSREEQILKQLSIPYHKVQLQEESI